MTIIKENIEALKKEHEGKRKRYRRQKKWPTSLGKQRPKHHFNLNLKSFAEGIVKKSGLKL